MSCIKCIYFQEVYFRTCLAKFGGPYLRASVWTPPPQNSSVISNFVFAYMSCTKCIYFQEVYFRTCSAGFGGPYLGASVWTLHHKIRLSLVILSLLICPAQNAFISRRYTFVHVWVYFGGHLLAFGRGFPPIKMSVTTQSIVRSSWQMQQKCF